MPRHLADAVLYAVNTGCREQEVCQLRWDWEVKIPDMGTSVFVLSESITKTSTERVVVLNSVAQRIIEGRRGINETYVFTYRDRAVGKMNNTAWKRAWRKAGLPVKKDIRRGVHNLRHTFARRLRSAGVPEETRATLMGHANGSITTHYSAAELAELKNAVEKIVDRGIAQTPTLTLISRQVKAVGNVSEIKKGAAGEIC